MHGDTGGQPPPNPSGSRAASPGPWHVQNNASAALPCPLNAARTLVICTLAQVTVLPGNTTPAFLFFTPVTTTVGPYPARFLIANFDLPVSSIVYPKRGGANAPALWWGRMALPSGLCPLTFTSLQSPESILILSAA